MKTFKTSLLTLTVCILGSALVSFKPEKKAFIKESAKGKQTLKTSKLRRLENGTIHLIINGLTNDNGSVIIGLYKGANGFPEYDKNYKNGAVISSKGSVEFTFDDIPKGEYAIALWQDENDNKILDKNIFGAPKEKYGFSNNKFGKLGPPKYEDVKFKIKNEEDLSLTINLR